MGFLSLVIQMSLNAAGVETGLKRAESSVSKFSKNVNSNLKAQIAGAIGAGALVAAAKAAVDYASKINDVSTRLGIGTGKIQEFAYAAKQTGGTLDDFAGAIAKISKARQEALNDPAGKMAQSFQKLGVNAEALKSARVEDLITKIGKSFQEARNPQELLSDGFQIMGKGALPVIGAMREGMTELVEQAKQLGLVLEDSAIQTLDDLGDKLDELKQTALAGFASELARLVGWVDKLMNGMKAGISGAAAYWGAVSGGASDAEAKKIGNRAFQDVVDDVVKRDQARANKKSARQRIAEETLNFSETAAATATTSKVSGISKSKLTNIQQIGAFSGVDPIVNELKSSHTTQRKIEANTKRMSMKKDAQSSDQF